jgi:glyoxylase-like metal-dependent hydrolase (beta-lactamase superfamily II)
MPALITVFPLGNADSARIDLADGRKILVDFGNQGNPEDRDDLRCDLAEEVRTDLRKLKRDNLDVVCFTHLDADHCEGASDFFYFHHAAKYQDGHRIKMDELWVPAAAITEDGLEDGARVIRQEARYRLKEGKGIRVFSRPEGAAELGARERRESRSPQALDRRRRHVSSRLLQGWAGACRVLRPLPLRLAHERERTGRAQPGFHCLPDHV